MGWDLKNKSDESLVSKNSIIIIGVTVLLLIIFCVFLASYIGNVSEQKDMYTMHSSTSSQLYATPITLEVKDKIVSNNVSILNDTYLSCDGVNDYLIIYPSSNDTLAFYYNSSTSVNWVYVVNVMGTKYNNSILEDPAEYPVYWNGTAYFFCKTDATTFWEGTIDKISTYDGQLNQTEIETLNQETRW